MAVTAAVGWEVLRAAEVQLAAWKWQVLSGARLNASIWT